MLLQLLAPHCEVCVARNFGYAAITAMFHYGEQDLLRQTAPHDSNTDILNIH
jgi:hypothetical protein